MNTQNSNSSFPLLPSVWSSEPSTIHNPTIQPSTSPNHYWLTEPAPNVDPALAKRSPWYAVQHVFCRRDTGELAGIIRRLKGEFKTAWFSGNSVTVKRHYTLRAAKKFLERQFTRTVPRCPDSTVQWFDSSRFRVLAPLPALTHRPCTSSDHAGAKIIQVNFSRSPRSKIKIQKSKMMVTPRILK
jgi:hypothetical protein